MAYEGEYVTLTAKVSRDAYDRLHGFADGEGMAITNLLEAFAGMLDSVVETHGVGLAKTGRALAAVSRQRKRDKPAR